MLGTLPTPKYLARELARDRFVNELFRLPEFAAALASWEAKWDEFDEAPEFERLAALWCMERGCAVGWLMDRIAVQARNQITGEVACDYTFIKAESWLIGAGHESRAAARARILGDLAQQVDAHLDREYAAATVEPLPVPFRDEIFKWLALRVGSRKRWAQIARARDKEASRTELTDACRRAATYLMLPLPVDRRGRPTANR